VDCMSRTLVSPSYLLMLARKLCELCSMFRTQHNGTLEILLRGGDQRLLLCNTQIILLLAFKLWFINYNTRTDRQTGRALCVIEKENIVLLSCLTL
jgi:hypothetical protein